MVKTLMFVSAIIFFISLFLVAQNVDIIREGMVKTLVTLQDFFFIFCSRGGVIGSLFFCVFLFYSPCC